MVILAFLCFLIARSYPEGHPDSILFYMFAAVFSVFTILAVGAWFVDKILFPIWKEYKKEKGKLKRYDEQEH